MFAGTKYNSVDSILVDIQKSRCRTNSNPFSSMMNDLPNLFIGQMESEKGRGSCRSKPFTTRTAIQKLPGFVLTILATPPYVAMVSQSIIFTLFVGTKSILDISHRSPPSY
ncbi:MAG: hypothetical protein IMF18_00715 [Proteobacteria bacterium]|nr:hypothetical protein [Pseudomonadota bacterium]